MLLSRVSPDGCRTEMSKDEPPNGGNTTIFQSKPAIAAGHPMLGPPWILPTNLNSSFPDRSMERVWHSPSDRDRARH
jgi:hypothetical protein